MAFSNLTCHNTVGCPLITRQIYFKMTIAANMSDTFEAKTAHPNNQLFKKMKIKTLPQSSCILIFNRSSFFQEHSILFQTFDAFLRVRSQNVYLILNPVISS